MLFLPGKTNSVKVLTTKPSRLLKLKASSTMALVASFFLPLMTPDVVTTTRDLQSTTRDASDSAENPAKTTEWTAPMRAHASMVIGSSPVCTSAISDTNDSLKNGWTMRVQGESQYQIDWHKTNDAAAAAAAAAGCYLTFNAAHC